MLSPRGTRNNVALALMAALVLGILSLLPIAKWHSSPSCDARTHIEMIRGVSEHGLPYGINGAMGTFPELRARWNIVRDDRLWGTYPPLFAYVAAPFFRIGGLAAASRMNIFLLVVMTLGVFALGARFFGDRLFGAVAAGLVLLSTPIPETSMDLSPYILAESLLVWSMFVALISIDAKPQKARFLAVFSGILGGLAVAAHLLTFPMLIGLLLALGFAGDEDGPAILRLPLLGPLESFIPSRHSLMRSAAMLGGMIIALLPVALLNHLRFSSYNPISYGPCPWRSCGETGQDQQHLGDIILYALPTMLWIGALIVSAWIARKKPFYFVVTAVFAVVPMVASSVLRIHAWQIALIAWGNIFDLSWIDISPIGTPPDGLGRMLGPWLIRSALQCTPLLILAVFVPFESRRARQTALLLALPSFFLYVACALRANEPPAFAFGFPFVYLRYTVPAAAPLTILALAAIRTFEWKRFHVAIVIAVSTALTLWLATGTEYDGPLGRRLFLLYGTLFSAIFAAFVVWRARRNDASELARLAPVAVAFAIAFGIGANLGVTFPAVWRLRDDNDTRLDRVAAITPDRFALVGFSAEIDTVLALRATRDIEYIDLYETDQSKGWGTFDALIDVWTKQGRPIYALWPAGSDPPSPWTDVAFERVLVSENLYRIRKL